MILLKNLAPEEGLVNGARGVVVRFVRQQSDEDQEEAELVTAHPPSHLSLPPFSSACSSSACGFTSVCNIAFAWLSFLVCIASHLFDVPCCLYVDAPLHVASRLPAAANGRVWARVSAGKGQGRRGAAACSALLRHRPAHQVCHILLLFK